MRTADKIPVGMIAVCLISRDLWNQHKSLSKFPGALLSVQCVFLPGAEMDSALFLDVYRGLRADHPVQASQDSSLWVRAYRRKRSSFVEIVGWGHPVSTDAADRVRRELKTETVSEVLGGAR